MSARDSPELEINLAGNKFYKGGVSWARGLEEGGVAKLFFDDYSPHGVSLASVVEEGTPSQHVEECSTLLPLLQVMSCRAESASRGKLFASESSGI